MNKSDVIKLFEARYAEGFSQIEKGIKEAIESGKTNYSFVYDDLSDEGHIERDYYIKRLENIGFTCVIGYSHVDVSLNYKDFNNDQSR